MKVYISIPISGHDYDTQKAEADRMKETLIECGYEAITPFDVAPEKDKPYSYYMGRDIEALLECDAVYFCQGHEHSKGCRLEYAAAITYDKTIMNY